MWVGGQKVIVAIFCGANSGSVEGQPRLASSTHPDAPGTQALPGKAP